MDFLPSRLLRINSRYCLNSFGNSRFIFQANSSLIDNCQKISLISASIPRLFTNIYHPINVLKYTVDDVEFQITIPEGQYTAEQLASQIDLDPGLTCRFDDITTRFIFGHTDAKGVQTLRANSPIAAYIGVTEDISLSPLSFTAADSVPSLAGPSQIYLESQFLSQNNCVSNLEDNLGNFLIPLMTVVDCSTVPYGFTIHYESKTDSNSQVNYKSLGVGSKVSLRSIDINLTDQFGNYLNLPNNAYVDLVFRFEYDA